MDAYTRFPSMAMIVRCLADAFDTRTKDKSLYEASVELPASLDYRRSQKLLEQEILRPLRSAGLLHTAEEIKRVYDLFEKDYLQKIVPKADIVGIHGEKEYCILIQYVFCLHAHSLLTSLLKTYSGPELFHLLAHAEEAVGYMLDWLGKNDSDWQRQEAELPRDRDKNNDHETILRWRNNDRAPSFERLTIMAFGEKHKALILLARVVAWTVQSDIGKQIIDGIKQVHWNVNLGQSFEELLAAIAERRVQTPSLQQLHMLMKDLFARLLKENKDKNEQEDTARIMRDMQKIIDDEGLNIIAQGPLDFASARWHLFSGDAKKAIALLENALHWSAYRAGPSQKEILESLLITAAGQNPPDMVAVKLAKNLYITFGYDIPSVPGDKYSGRNRSADLVEDWEIAMWAREYQKHTPSCLFFPGAEPKGQVSYPFIVLPMTSNTKPDYSSRDRRIKLNKGQGQPVRYPQLCYYILKRDLDIVKKLLKKKASVNVRTSSGDTPLLLAVGSIPHDHNTVFFDLIASHPHEKEIVNARTKKKRKTALLKAIEVGNPAVVQKILDMGADANLRGETDMQSPLYCALSRYGLQKKPEILQEARRKHLDDPYAQAGLRRYTNGLLGSTLQDQKVGFVNLLKSKRHRAIADAIFDYYFPGDGAEPESRLEIIRLLLAYGADPNAEQQTPIPGYTPLMLACELNLSDIVADMLEKYNGNLDATLTLDKPVPRTLTLYDIAEGHKASAVAEVIIDKKSAMLKP